MMALALAAPAMAHDGDSEGHGHGPCILDGATCLTDMTRISVTDVTTGERIGDWCDDPRFASYIRANPDAC